MTEPSSKTRYILLADDHAAIRMGVRSLVLGLWPDAIVVEVSDGISLGRELSARDWSLVVLDQTMPGANGLEVLARLSTKPPVLVYTMHDSPEIVRKAREAGASGFVTKSCDPSVLEKAVLEVAAGGTWFTQSNDSGLEQLSQREREVLDALLEGLGPKEIGVRLSISASSVQTHVTRLLAKLGLKSTRELFRWAASRGHL
jgi:DNA-binding NarL/FixJ family response regulator